MSVDGALEVLSERERHILNCFFIDHPAKGGVAALCSTLGSTKEEVYKLKERALRHFTLALYGISDG